MEKSYTEIEFLLSDQVTSSFKSKQKHKTAKAPVLEKFLLITGCARSGTKFISDFLYINGLDMPHEGIGREGSVSWLMAVDAKGTPWGPSSKGVHYQHVFHQVRHPLKVMSSVYTTEPMETWFYIMKNIPQIHWHDSKEVKAAKYWYYWNLKAEKKAEWTYRIEDIHQLIDEMSQKLDYPLNPALLEIVAHDRNSRGVHRKEFTWKHLKQILDKKLYKKIIHMAKRYGYSTED